MHELRAQYGAGYDDVTRDMRTLATRDPRVAELFNATAIGHDPRVILRMAELAVSARRAGKLPPRKS